MHQDTKGGVLWTEDVGALLRHPDQFFPNNGLSQAENTNALVRLSIYIGVAIGILRKKMAPLVVGIVIALFVTLLFARRERECLRLTLKNNSCRSPTLANPMMNKPVITDEEDAARIPCTDLKSLEKADSFTRAYTAKDAEDVLASEYENREFLVLPDGGAGPDFSKLGQYLSHGTSLQTF
jgi:hypothetical protein